MRTFQLNNREIKHTLLSIMLLAMSVLMVGCFKDPITGPIEGKPVNPGPVFVAEDSVLVNVVDDDDLGGGDRHSFTLASRAPHLGLKDSSIIRIDTVGRVPVLHMNLTIAPVYKSANDAKDAKVKLVRIVIDSMPILGDDWMYLHAGQIKYLVRVSDKPVPRYAIVDLLQPRPGPYMRDDTFARFIMWKVTNKREIVFHFESQINYTVQNGGGPSRERSKAAGTVRLRY